MAETGTIAKRRVRPLVAGTVYTTGGVAKICRVAPRTVSKWFDSGQLKGYRIPGSQDRRIPRENLIRFLKEHNMPMGELMDPLHRVLLVGLSAGLAKAVADLLPAGFEWRVQAVQSGFAVGVAITEDRPNVVVIDLGVGRSEAVQVVESVRARDGAEPVLAVALAGEDETDAAGLRKAGFDEVAVAPVDPVALAGLIQRHHEG